MENSNIDTDYTLAELTSELVGAYVSNNPLASTDLPNLIYDVHAALGTIAGKSHLASTEKPVPAVPIKKSVKREYIVCLEDGKRFKSLKRHLKSHFDMSPDQYREKWGLPADYPMVAPAYAEKRSQLAREIGLGRKRKS